MAKNRKRSRRYRPSAMPTPRRIPRPRVEIDRGLAWYALWTASRAEKRVAERLRDAGLATYLPSETLQLVRRGKTVEVERPAVSRYVFVGLNAVAPQFDAVHGALEEWAGLWPMTLGRLLRTSEGPLRVPAGALQRLADGLVVYDSPKPSLRPGEAYRPVSGPFAGMTAIIEAADDTRVRALVSLFGGRVPVEFDADQLEAA